jgi:hypothetical protein
MTASILLPMQQQPGDPETYRQRGIIPLMTTDLFCCERGGVDAVREIKYEKLIGIFPNISQMSFEFGNNMGIFPNNSQIK